MYYILPIGPCESTQVSHHFRIVAAVEKIIARLRRKYAAHFHDDTALDRVLADAEESAWETPFPHLFLPALAEARVAEFVPDHDLALAA